MKKEYWFILIAYIAMQLSSLIGIPLITFLGAFFGKNIREMEVLAVPYWLVISFTVTLIIVLLLLRKEIITGSNTRNAASAISSFFWSVGGVFLALFAQSIAANFERLIGIKMGSENTQQIISIIESFPFVILVSSFIGPILEEIVFRKIIFGALHKRLNFFLSALISSVIFALAHFEPEHIILYSTMGFTFAYLYVKTQRIIVPIIAHVTMNTFVVLIQSVYREDIERILRDMEKIQSLIGGF
ncbi:CPBP family intramembrane glutamic endopeptidase [Bacillus methanolicus]|uniref:Membrane peptidase YdiL n=1 Tax=Bacillus methanolicus (strain MGA3 / ATCC 53907) TaxID=796606 RepID=I3DU04_BACMM|nr:CPBP family intramembrane glutamic endopeptidase [Bacillus methanolicus]AIE58769.1 Putative membrane peptidase YdiL [Bacillus methanolicus MGA3]EIJ77725.1 Abortive infection protein [Bacillus methanolicus MGA3]UQD50871.1 CPBP family intramembrane metalloprotease [Bacillus methanolicus]